MSKIKLTQYSHGAGCGCKISPSDLSDILKTSLPAHNDKRLLVGNGSRDDAAVYDMGDGTAIISTTDFFMPIADDPFVFGKIAAANAISDVYAMGGETTACHRHFGLAHRETSGRCGCTGNGRGTGYLQRSRHCLGWRAQY